MKILITGAAVALPASMPLDCNVLFGDRILYVGPDKPDADVCINGEGLVLAPGFIDIHTHGCGGVDTMDGGDASCEISELVVKGGTTSFLPTTVTAPAQALHAALDGVRGGIPRAEGANILGAHVEGPFLSPRYKGAHEERFLALPDFRLIDGYADIIKIVTLAPELDGAKGFIESCVENDIICSIGHTGATCEQCANALEWGASSFTHAYNAMSPLSHRAPGTVGALLSSDAFAELICDNIHVAPPAQKILLAAKGNGKTILITDALRLCMAGDGPFTLGGLSGTVKNGRAELPDGTLAGSVLTMNAAVRNFRLNTGCELWEAVRCAATNPAELLGLTQKGRIAEGGDADLVLMTPECEIACTFINGEIKYKA
ncbi:MAG: N-acetylglucosamine-6-phosphate deacetylase [Oscillospiraceae bacterium]|nr:N-acetylglucosamine-6-phosphate deacetylase [Oscillospiraceae bacterium]